MIKFIYCEKATKFEKNVHLFLTLLKFARSNTTHLEAHFQSNYVLRPFDKQLISSLVTGVRTREYTVIT